MPYCLLTLKNNKYYIHRHNYEDDAQINNLKVTIEDSDWIQKDNIISVDKIDSNDSIEDVTFTFMRKYGIDNVRSVFYPNKILSSYDLELITSNIYIGKLNIINKKIDELKEKYIKLDNQYYIIKKYANYMNYVINTTNIFSKSLNSIERSAIIYYENSNTYYPLNLYEIKPIEKYLNNLLKFYEKQKFTVDYSKIINEIKKKITTSYFFDESIVQAKVEEIKYSKMMESYGLKEDIGKDIKKLLNEKLNIIESVEYQFSVKV